MINKSSAGVFDYAKIRQHQRVGPASMLPHADQREALRWMWDEKNILVCNSQGDIKWSEKVPQMNLPHHGEQMRYMALFEGMKLQGIQPVLYLEGGLDVTPSVYGEDDRYCGATSLELDKMEIAMIVAAIANEVPIFANCRGHQLFNAWAGGSLWQDIGRERNSQHPGMHKISLGIDFYEYSLLLGLESPADFVANSTHHQGVKEVALTGEVVGVAYDGLIEMTLHRSLRAFTTQHHPEFLDDFAFFVWVLKNLLNV